MIDDAEFARRVSLMINQLDGLNGTDCGAVLASVIVTVAKNFSKQPEAFVDYVHDIGVNGLDNFTSIPLSKAN